MEETPTAEKTTTTSAAPDDLLNRLSRSTETKAPGATTANDVKPFWERTDEDFEPEPKKPEKTDENKPDTTGEQIQAPALSEKIKNASAATAVGALNVVLTGAFIPEQNFKLKKKFKKSFSPDQLKTIEEKLSDCEDEDIEDAAEKLLKKRFDAIMKKYNKKIEAVPMSEKEREEFHQACFNYMEITGKSLPPGLFLGMSLTQIIGNRIIDAATD